MREKKKKKKKTSWWYFTKPTVDTHSLKLTLKKDDNHKQKGKTCGVERCCIFVIIDKIKSGGESRLIKRKVPLSL